MTHDPCTVPALRDHAETWARRLRYGALGLAGLTLIPDFIVWALALRYEPRTELALSWGIATLSAAAAVTALLLFASRTVWNFSNVWLGRAGTLEDLSLALGLMGVDPSVQQKLPDGKAVEL